MLILFDQSTAVPIRHYLIGHTVKTAREQGWDRLANGTLLRAAETAGFDVLLTADHGFAHQQNEKLQNCRGHIRPRTVASHKASGGARCCGNRSCTSANSHDGGNLNRICGIAVSL